MQLLFPVNMTLQKGLTACVASMLALIAPIKPLLLVAFEFVLFDFIIGVWASRSRAKKAGKLSEWGFESKKAWRTLYKLVFVLMGIVFAFHLDSYVLSFADLKLPNLFCGFVCGVELWSFLENAASISDYPVFRWLKKYMGEKVKEVTGQDIEKLQEKERE